MTLKWHPQNNAYNLFQMENILLNTFDAFANNNHSTTADNYQNMSYRQTINTFGAPQKAHQGHLGTFVSMLLTTFDIITEKIAFTKLFLCLNNSLLNTTGTI